MDPWQELGIGRTTDEAVIRRAYATRPPSSACAALTRRRRISEQIERLRDRIEAIRWHARISAAASAPPPGSPGQSCRAAGAASAGAISRLPRPNWRPFGGMPIGLKVAPILTALERNSPRWKRNSDVTCFALSSSCFFACRCGQCPCWKRYHGSGIVWLGFIAFVMLQS